MTNKNKSESSRQRGVRASLIKIRAAMVKVGLHSQTDIAKKIQEIEQTSSIPRSLVSRVCRGEAVDPVSIERVATALNLPGWQLYVNSAEQNVEGLHQDDLLTIPTNTIDVPIKNDKQFKFRYRGTIILAGLSLLLIISVWNIHLLRTVTDDSSALPLIDFITDSDKSIVSLLIWPKDTLSKATAESLAIKSFTKNINASLLNKNFESSVQSIDLAKHYESDAVLTLSAKRKGRYIVQQAQMYFDGVERVIGYDVFPLANQMMYVTIISSKLQTTITQFLTYPQKPFIYDASFMHGMDVVLDARILLDKRDMQKDGDKVTAILLSAISEGNDIADLHAALCQTYMLNSWKDEEKQHLDQAASACNQAILLDPDSPYAQALNAELATLTGQTKVAIDSYQQILETWPNHLLSLSGSAAAYLNAANQLLTDADSVLNKAEQNLLQAIMLEDDYWYYYETLATVYFNLQQTDKSLDYFQSSANLSKNPVSLTNVGILTLCNGDYLKAENLFQEVIQVAPYSHLGHQFLGLLYSYQGKSTEAIEQIQVALDKLGNQDGANIYNYWGYLADVYRWSGKKELAISAYNQAIKSLQHYRLRGVSGISEDASQLYYEIQISQLSQTLDQDSQHLLTRFELLKVQDAGMAFNLKISQVELILDNRSGSIERWTKLSGQCQFYQLNPDFKDIADNI